MRIESSVTTVSWIPSEAVSGPVLKGTFDSGITSYDDPPGDTIDDLEAWREAGTFRFANHLAAWVEIDGGRIVDCGYTGGGLMGSTTVRLAKLRATFEPVALPDLHQEPERSDTQVRFVQTTGGRTGLPAPRRVIPYLPALWASRALHAMGLHLLPEPALIEMAAQYWAMESKYSGGELGYRSRPGPETIGDTVTWLGSARRDK